MMERVILMVDDDPDDRELFCEAVDDIDQNIKCYTVDSAEGAIKFLSTSRVIPDIIFFGHQHARHEWLGMSSPTEERA